MSIYTKMHQVMVESEAIEKNMTGRRPELI